jgi:hypothetical protein
VKSEASMTIVINRLLDLLLVALILRGIERSR